MKDKFSFIFSSKISGTLLFKPSITITSWKEAMVMLGLKITIDKTRNKLKNIKYWKRIRGETTTTENITTIR